MTSLEERYCSGCSYPLTGLTSNNCPECGRVFDPEDPYSFRWTPDPTHRKDTPGMERLLQRFPPTGPGERNILALVILLSVGLIFRFAEFFIPGGTGDWGLVPTPYWLVILGYLLWQLALAWVGASFVRNSRAANPLGRAATGAAVGLVGGLFFLPWGLFSGLIVGALAGFIQSVREDY